MLPMVRRFDMKATLIILSLQVLAAASLLASPTRTERAPQYEVTTVSNGKASWYGGRWIGRKTANGEIYRNGDMTAAHKTLPFGTMVRVTDERSERSTVVRINNRGPFVKGRVLDLSEAAAEKLGMKSRGIARVKIEVLTVREAVEMPPAPVLPKNWFTVLFASRSRSLATE